MKIIEVDSSLTSSSTSSQTDTTQPITSSLRKHTKRKSGRKKYKETRHPVYKGVRLRNGSKWVCEILEPDTKSRIWLGTFPTPEMAARAYDAAVLALHGDNSPLNFTDSTCLVRRAKPTSACDIREAALEAALTCGLNRLDIKPSFSVKMEDYENVLTDMMDKSFVDEEVLFDMPSFYNSMAEGLVVTPPGMKKRFDWSDDVNSNIYLTLWRY